VSIVGLILPLYIIRWFGVEHPGDILSQRDIRSTKAYFSRSLISLYINSSASSYFVVDELEDGHSAPNNLGRRPSVPFTQGVDSLGNIASDVYG
jgi:hypothetical protein